MICRCFSLVVLAVSALAQLEVPTSVETDANCAAFVSETPVAAADDVETQGDRWVFDIVTGSESVTLHDLAFVAARDRGDITVRVRAYRGSFLDGGVLDDVSDDIIVPGFSAGATVYLGIDAQLEIPANSSRGILLAVLSDDDECFQYSLDDDRAIGGEFLAVGDVLSVTTGRVTRAGETLPGEPLAGVAQFNGAICFSISDDEELLDDVVLLSQNEVPPMLGVGESNVVVTYDPRTRLLSWRVVAVQLAGAQVPVIQAHFHGPASTSENGLVQVVLYDMDRDQGIEYTAGLEGFVFLNSTQEADLLAGLWYVNVHTERNPSGELRGQVNETLPLLDRNWFTLSPDAVEIGGDALAVSTNASGDATITLDRETGALAYRVAFRNTSSEPMALTLNGPAAVNETAGVQFTLVDDDLSFSRGPVFTGDLTIEGQDIQDVTDGLWYVLVTTDLNVDGELRGQVVDVPTPIPTPVPSPVPTLFPTTSLALSNLIALTTDALLQGGGELQEPTNATATAQVDYDRVTGELSWTVEFQNLTSDVLSIDFRGPANDTAAADVVVPIADAGAESPVMGSAIIELALADDLVDELWFVQIDTDSNPGGELRGQVVQAPTPTPTLAPTPPVPTMVGEILVQMAQITLTTDAQEAAGTMLQTASTATGQASVWLTQDNRLGWDLSFSGLTSDTLFAHFHGPASMYEVAGVRVLISGEPFTSPNSGLIAISSDLATELLDGMWYINVHTVGNPNGEIRGQVAAFTQVAIPDPFVDDNVGPASALQVSTVWIVVATISAAFATLN